MVTDAGRVCATSHCTGCGTCVSACPERALSLSSEQPDGRGRKVAVLAEVRCTGCNTCLPACPRGALITGTVTSL